MFEGSEPGCGAGKGGGAGGSIREADGSLGKREATLEDEYFRRLDKQNIEALKDKLNKKSVVENQSSVGVAFNIDH